MLHMKKFFGSLQVFLHHQHHNSFVRPDCRFVCSAGKGDTVLGSRGAWCEPSTGRMCSSIRKVYCNWSTLFDVVPLWPALAKDPRDSTNCAAAQQAVHIYVDRRRCTSISSLDINYEHNSENRNVNFTGNHFTYQIIVTNCGTVVRKIKYFFFGGGDFLGKGLAQM